MNHLISCTLVASLALSGVALDSKTWARFYPGLPHAPLIESESAHADEPQSIYHFSGASDVLSLAGGEIMLHDAKADSNAFNGGTLQTTLSDVTAYSYTYTATKDGTTYLLSSGSGEGSPENITNAPMGIASAKATRFEDTTLTADDLQDSLTFTLTTTHADGTTQTHTLPLAPDGGTITH